VVVKVAGQIIEQGKAAVFAGQHGFTGQGNVQ
jgi:hypothetical protein